MNDMARSAIYDTFHEIIPLQKSSKKFKKKIEFVGPICESSDTFGIYKNYSSLKEGEYVCITNCGAYGRTLSSNYNMRPLIEELILSNNKLNTVRLRQKIEDLI
jgi:diaminopimelate decarboxylase